MTDLLSTLPLDQWRGDATMFDGFYSTSPVDELVRGSFGRLSHSFAPGDSPILTNDKAKAPYYAPCPLQNAPLTPKTAARTSSARSRSPR